MRQDTATIAEGATIEEFRRRFPLGSATRVILLDKSDRYAGLVVAAQAFEDSAKREAAVSDLRQSHDVSLRPDMNIEQVMRVFDAHGVEELAVVDDAGQLLGVLAENYVTRRYARELEKRQREVFGEA